MEKKPRFKAENQDQLSKMDFSLVQVLALQSKKTSFLITDPKLPGNPIVYASPGFVNLTGAERCVLRVVVSS